VRLNAGSKYQFDLQAAASSPYLDTYLKLNNFDQSATLLESDDINMFDHNSRLVFTATKTGFYDLDVSSYAHNSLGDYTIGFRAINNVI
jgi:hypothetical protein